MGLNSSHPVVMWPLILIVQHVTHGLVVALVLTHLCCCPWYISKAHAMMITNWFSVYDTVLLIVVLECAQASYFFKVGCKTACQLMPAAGLHISRGLCLFISSFSLSA